MKPFVYWRAVLLRIFIYAFSAILLEIAVGNSRQGTIFGWILIFAGVGLIVWNTPAMWRLVAVRIPWQKTVVVGPSELENLRIRIPVVPNAVLELFFETDIKLADGTISLGNSGTELNRVLLKPTGKPGGKSMTPGPIRIPVSGIADGNLELVIKLRFHVPQPRKAETLYMRQTQALW